MPAQMQCHGATHIGQARADNQDQFLIADLNKSMRIYQTTLGLDHQTRLFGGTQGTLLLVADGMGGHASGERASSLAVDTIATYLLNTMPWFFRLDEKGDEQSEAEFRDNLQEALRQCQKALAEEVQEIPQRRGLGTTVTFAYVLWPRLYVVHVGDSRCYLCRESQLQRLTRDHTVSQFYADLLHDRGEAEQPNSAWSNVLWNVVGGDSEELTIDVYRADLQADDWLLLCTDGLTKHVPDARLTEVLSGGLSPGDVCDLLVAEANEAGGTDNITVVVAHFMDRPDRHEAEEDVLLSASADITEKRTSGETDPYIPLDARD